MRSATTEAPGVPAAPSPDGLAGPLPEGMRGVGDCGESGEPGGPAGGLVSAIIVCLFLLSLQDPGGCRRVRREARSTLKINRLATRPTSIRDGLSDGRS